MGIEPLTSTLHRNSLKDILKQILNKLTYQTKQFVLYTVFVYGFMLARKSWLITSSFVE